MKNMVNMTFEKIEPFHFANFYFGQNCFLDQVFVGHTKFFWTLTTFKADENFSFVFRQLFEYAVISRSLKKVDQFNFKL